MFGLSCKSHIKALIANHFFSNLHIFNAQRQIKASGFNISSSHTRFFFSWLQIHFFFIFFWYSADSADSHQWIPKSFCSYKFTHLFGSYTWFRRFSQIPSGSTARPRRYHHGVLSAVPDETHPAATRLTSLESQLESPKGTTGTSSVRLGEKISEKNKTCTKPWN